MSVKSVFAAAAVAAAAAVFAAPLASADEALVTHTQMGGQAELVNGAVVQGWTISHLKPSHDAIPYHPVGKLWEATATDVAIQGSATPIVSNFNARAGNGDTYRVLFGVATPQGVNPATLAQGEKTTGKLYFDVTGAPPVSVFYAEGDGPALAAWVQPAPAPAGGPRPAATPAAPSAPAEGSPDDSATEAIADGDAEGEALSEGTPLPEDAEGTPLIPPVTPVDEAVTPGTEGASTAAPEAEGDATAATPSAEGAEPASSEPAAAEASEGTPLEEELLDQGPLEEQLIG